VCVCARVRVRALRSYLWLKLYKVSQCTRSTRIPMRAPGASLPVLFCGSVTHWTIHG